MSSVIDMSLEDIIQKKKGKIRNNNSGKVNKFKKPAGAVQKLPVTDARNKIISKKRNQITDAREKLAQLAKQKDARIKLEQLRLNKLALSSHGMGIPRSRNQVNKPDHYMIRTIQNKEPIFSDPTRQIRSQPHHANPPRVSKHQTHGKRFMENRSVGTRNIERTSRPKPILRTVENDVVIMDDEDDPMGEDFPAPVLLNRKASLNLKIVADNNDARESRSRDARDRIGSFRSAAHMDREPSPPRRPSILKKRPMAALAMDKRIEPKIEEERSKEYRIIVSNLRNTVTGADIQELFGDIGGMMESRLVRPGTAEVIYRSLESAQKAVDLYHNRQLDGHPMNCLLVVPRSANPGASSKPSIPASSNSNVEPDLSTFHKVLFSHF